VDFDADVHAVDVLVTGEDGISAEPRIGRAQSGQGRIRIGCGPEAKGFLESGLQERESAEGGGVLNLASDARMPIVRRSRASMLNCNAIAAMATTSQSAASSANPRRALIGPAR
jgi:hypothetical protein